MPGSPVIATIAPRPSARSAMTPSSAASSASRPTRGDIFFALALPRADDAEDLERRGLALELERSDRLELERVLDLLRCCGADRDAALPRRRLESRRGVDRVAERVEPLLGRRVVVGEQDDRTGVDADAARELDSVRLGDVLAVAGERRLHRERRAHRAFRIVVVRRGHAEQRVQPVARELRDGSSEALHLGDEQADHLVEEELRALGPDPLADRGRVGDVGQEDRHDASLPFARSHRAIIARALACPHGPGLDSRPPRHGSDVRRGGRSLHDAPSLLTFIVATFALAGLAWIVAFATEQVGERFGPAVTGLLQSTLGNLPEFFIVVFALSAGELVVARAAILGSIFANALFVLGFVIIAGCIESSDGVMRFHRRLPKDNATLLLLASFLIVILGISVQTGDKASHHVTAISIVGAIALLVTYGVWLVDYLRSDSPVERERGRAGDPALARAHAARRRRRRRRVRRGLVHRVAVARDGAGRHPEGVRRSRDRRDRGKRRREHDRCRARARGATPISRSPS